MKCDILLKLSINRGIAQLVEQRSPKPRAVSSSLTTPAKVKSPQMLDISLFAGIFVLNL